MHHRHAHTALLFFARRASKEAEYKKVAKHHNQAILAQLRDHAWKTARATGLPCLIVDDRRQQGHTFGARFVGALREVFRMGYGRVIAIGGDAPELRVHHIQRAQKILQHQDWVLGPDRRGGAYLIGLTRQAFQQGNDLQHIPWQSEHTLRALQHCARRQRQSVHLLPYLTDLNSTSDLQGWLAQQPGRRLARRIRGLLAQNRLPHFFLPQHHAFLRLPRTGRAPPRGY